MGQPRLLVVNNSRTFELRGIILIIIPGVVDLQTTKPLLILFSLRHHSDIAQVFESANCVGQLHLDTTSCEEPSRPRGAGARDGPVLGVEDFEGVRTWNPSPPK